MNEKFLTELQAQATWAIEAEKRKVNPTAKFDPAITPQQALELVACVRESEQLREEREPWQRCFQAEFLSWREAARERDDLQAKLDAVRALNLTGPGFTREDLGNIWCLCANERQAVKHCLARHDPAARIRYDRANALLAKLDAYLEGLDK